MSILTTLIKDKTSFMLGFGIGGAVVAGIILAPLIVLFCACIMVGTWYILKQKKLKDMEQGLQKTTEKKRRNKKKKKHKEEEEEE